jgi:hypothetical protein
MINGGCAVVVSFGVTVLPCAEEIRQPTGMLVVGLLIAIVRFVIGT